MCGCMTRNDEHNESDFKTKIEEIENENKVMTPNDKESLDEDTLTAFLTIIESVDVTYGYEDYYPSDQDIEEYQGIARTFATCPEEYTDYEFLVDQIEKNTIAKYGRDNGIFIVPDESYTESEYLRLLEIGPKVKTAIKFALKNIFENAVNDTDEDICKLKGVSIINRDLSEEQDNGFLGEWDNEKSTIRIDYDEILAANEFKKDKDYYTRFEFDEYLIKTIEHELNHVRQYACKHRLDQKQINKTIAPEENFTFISETSAEAETYAHKSMKVLNKQSSFDYTYKDERDLETLLLLLAVFKSDKNLDNYHRAIFDSDLNALWEFFELNDKNALKNFYSIVYAIDTLNNRTDLTAVLAEGEETILRRDIKQKVGTNYLVDIYKTATIDLIRATEKEELTLDESLLLYLFLKSTITSSSYSKYYIEIDGSIETKYDDFYVDGIVIIETAYMDYLSAKFSLSREEIKTKLNSNTLDFNIYDFTRYVLNEDVLYDSSNIPSYKKLSDKHPLIKYITWTNTSYIFPVKDFDEYASEREKQLVLSQNK